MGDDREIDASRCLEQFRRQILGAADVDGADIEGAGLVPGGGDEVRKRLELRIGAGDEDEIEKTQTGNRFEIPQGIERQFLEQGDADRGAIGQQRQRIAVRRRGDHGSGGYTLALRSEEHTSELQSPDHLVCRLLLEKKKTKSARVAGDDSSFVSEDGKLTKIP